MLLDLSTIAWAAADKPAGSPFGQILPMLLMIGVAFWFIVLRPQKREKQQRQQQMAELKKGDRIVTIGGLHGKVVDSDPEKDFITIEVAPKTPLKVSRSAVASVDAKDSPKPPEK